MISLPPLFIFILQLRYFQAAAIISFFHFLQFHASCIAACRHSEPPFGFTERISLSPARYAVHASASVFFGFCADVFSELSPPQLSFCAALLPPADEPPTPHAITPPFARDAFHY